MGQVLLSHFQWTMKMKLGDVEITKEGCFKALYLEGPRSAPYTEQEEINRLSLDQVMKMGNTDSTISKGKTPSPRIP